MKPIRLPIRLLGIVLTLTAAGQTAAAGLEETIAGCNGCHGEAGVSQWNDVPTIAGVDAFVHSEALYAFRDESRPCAMTEIRQGPQAGDSTSMCEVTAALSDEDVEALAAHYSALSFVPAAQDYDAALAATGKAVHDNQCIICHSDGGSNPDDEAGILAGQWMGYLRTAFAEFASGERDQPDAMKQRIDALGDDDVTALLHYYASQQ